MRERILVIGNYQQTITVIRSLARAGCEVVAGREGLKAFTERSRFASEVWSHPNPLHRADFLISLNEFLHRRQDIRYLFPVGEADIEALSSLYEELNRTRGLVMARPDVIEKCLNKAKTYDMAARLGIPMPETCTATNFCDLKTKAHRLGPPLVIKPINSLGLLLGEKAIICRSLGELDGWAPGLSRESRPLILQRWVRGERHNCHFAALSGTIVAYFEQKVLRTDRLNGTGYGVDSVSVRPLPQLRRYCEALTQTLQYSGVGCIQFLVDESSSQAAFLEINPRLDATCELPYRCGFDFPRIALQCTARRHGGDRGRCLGVPSGYPEGKRLYWLHGDLRGLRGWMKSPESSCLGIWPWLKRMAASFRKADYHLTWSWTDPLPSLFLYWKACESILRGNRAAGRFFNNRTALRKKVWQTLRSK